MLKKVHFILQKETGEKLEQALYPLVSDLRNHGVETIDSVIDSGQDKPQILSGNVSRTGVKEKKTSREPARNAKIDDGAGRGILYITDSDLCYHSLKGMGQYVLPYIHKGNQGASFAGAKFAIEQIEETDYKIIDIAYRRIAGISCDILETERCIVRETRVEDVDSFYDIYAEPSITEYIENLYADREEEVAYIQDYIEHVYGFYGYGVWTVVEKNSGQIIGRAGISWREGFDVPELGFVIGLPWQGREYAYEVCQAILAYAKEKIKFTTLQALVMEENEKSKRLCRKLGFEEKEKIVLSNRDYIRFVTEFGRRGD